MQLARIKYLVIDVDGTMTDSGIYYDENGNELKRFSTKDGAGFFACQRGGIEIIVITGRMCQATSRRMQEMHVDKLFQNITKKREFLENYMNENKISKDEIGYIGDDVNDIPPMQLCGFVGCPKDSCKEVLDIADYVSPICGGRGAMRDVIEYIFRQRGQWDELLKVIYGGI